MEHRWILVYDRYDGPAKRAVNLLSGTVSGYLSYVLPARAAGTVTEAELADSDLLCVGRPETHPMLAELVSGGLLSMPGKPEGYAIYAGENPRFPGRQIIAVAGEDEAGLFYGCADFCTRYCGDVLFREGYLWDRDRFVHPMEQPLPPWSVSSAPAIATRGIWTWGHVIWDYRGFFDNMALLRLNEAVIWNDRAPLNAGDVVAYAHSLGIRVVWGFAWGWDQGFRVDPEQLTGEALQRLKASVLHTYETEYAHAAGDGIYFQSFTELNEDHVAGQCIAEVVTGLVNDIAGTLLEKHPDLHIQFGLHATSVRTHPDIIARTDPRVHIVWEDCGAFPWHYETDRTEDFDETLALTERLLCLRGEEERFGAVLKGMMNLDWHHFEHFSQPYILGERSAEFLQERLREKDPAWKYVQAGWLKNLPLVQKTAQVMARRPESIVLALVEDGMLERRITLPAALFAALLWDPCQETGALLETLSRVPHVYFANR